jgi:hypothetical protein
MQKARQSSATCLLWIAKMFEKYTEYTWTVMQRNKIAQQKAMALLNVVLIVCLAVTLVQVQGCEEISPTGFKLDDKAEDKRG